MQQETDLTDISRILFGEVPGEFFIEIIIRLIIMYIIALVTLRFMGKRMAAQLSRNELAALVSVSAAIGVSIQAPDRGLLPSFVIAIVIILVGRFMSWRAYKNRRFEERTQGKLSVLVEDAVLQLETMTQVRISKERIFAQLRSEDLKNLGEVKRLYMEANGTFSLVKAVSSKPGLSLVPDWDTDLRNEQKKLDNLKACATCGYLEDRSKDRKDGSCKSCKTTDWTDAVC